ncbi:Pollike protein putative [Phytophthora palmivora]|uniref:Pollike protein putative n=1 Tax=Phytophthora palmivora TaxID=4796 RepID=A0A2P4YMR8_9STRA|nr:Pollike protein putative [Phytophthora palmivora]
MHSKNGKAPGTDGIPIEYYNISVVHDSQLSKGQMTKFQRRAHLLVSFKAVILPDNNRSLTLLNHAPKLLV